MTDQNSNVPVDVVEEVVVTPSDEAVVEVAAEEVAAPAEVATEEVVADVAPEVTA